jgi:hypothetical protein
MAGGPDTHLRRHRARGHRATRALTLAALALVLAAAPAEARTPGDFYGVVAQGPIRDGDHAQMREAGAGVLRFPLEWAQVERQPGVYDWTAVDSVVNGAVAQGIEPLPFIWATPEWLNAQKAVPPLESSGQRRAWERFLAAVTARYGSVVDKWQLWNEPNFKVYWKPKPQPRAYAELVRLGARVIRAGDPDAEIILGGVAPVKRGMLPWEFLEDVYDVRGVERWFDTVAVHPYFPELDGVEFQVRQALDEIDAARDRRARIRVTELGWASEGPAADPMTKGLEGQARMLRRSFRLLTKRRRAWHVTGVDWHSFQDVAADEGEPVCSFCPGSGLVTASREPKPAFGAFADFARP